MSDKEIKRVPRPLGLTMMMKQVRGTHSLSPSQDALQKTKQSGEISVLPKTINNEALHRVKQILIEQWVATGMTLNGQSYTIDKLSTFLNVPVSYIYKHMQIAMKKMGKWLGDEEGLKEKSRAIISLCLNKGLENMALNRSQVELLLASQGGEYQPFISSAVNQALANNTASLNPILAILKQLTEKTQTNIFIDNSKKESLIQNNQYLTTDTALKLIASNAESMALDPTLADAYIGMIKGLPDVSAKTQDLRSIGVKYDGTKDAKALQGSTATTVILPTKEAKKEKHRKRSKEFEEALVIMDEPTA